MENLQELKREMLTSDKWVYHTPEEYGGCFGTLHCLIDELWEEIIYSLPKYHKKACEKEILDHEYLCKKMLIDDILHLAIQNKMATRDNPLYFGTPKYHSIYYSPETSYETLGNHYHYISWS